LIYCMLDQKREIDVVHLQAALAVWKYCEDGARYLFGNATGDPLADKILKILFAAGSEGKTRGEIYEKLGGKISRADTDAALQLLLEDGLAHKGPPRMTRGRSATVWILTMHD